MKGKQKNTSDIDFGRDKVTVYLTEYEYERIESVGRGGDKDGGAEELRRQDCHRSTQRHQLPVGR